METDLPLNLPSHEASRSSLVWDLQRSWRSWHSASTKIRRYSSFFISQSTDELRAIQNIFPIMIMILKKKSNKYYQYPSHIIKILSRLIFKKIVDSCPVNGLGSVHDPQYYPNHDNWLVVHPLAIMILSRKQIHDIIHDNYPLMRKYSLAIMVWSISLRSL